MCRRFAQAQTRQKYLAYLADEADRDIPYDQEPIGRYNVAPGTKVLLLKQTTPVRRKSSFGLKNFMTHTLNTVFIYSIFY